MELQTRFCHSASSYFPYPYYILPLRSATFSAFVPQPTTELWAHKVCVDSEVHTALVEDGGTTQIFRLAEALSSLQFHMYVV